MSAIPTYFLLAAGAFAAASGGFARASTPTLTIERITRGGQRIASASDVTLRGLDGSLLRQGVHEGDVLPDDVQVSVPAGERVLIGAGAGDVTLDGATDSFHSTVRFESVAMLAPGRTEIDDRSDAFRFFGPGFELAVHDGSFVVDIADGRATVTRGAGTVTADLLGSTAFVRRVDVLSDAHPSITYTLGDETLANASVEADASAAAAGDAVGEFNLGTRFFWGDGVTADAAQAMRWLRAAAAQRFAEAENSIGYAYVYGSAVAQDPAQGLHWFLLAAADGSAAAEDTLGDMYNDGHGVSQSDAQAMHWYQLSAAQGDADAENDIGLLYLLGHGSYFGDTAPEYNEALRWFWIAVAQGNGDGENDIGYLYETGHGVPLDDARALYWYRLAATQRDPGAEYNIGIMYERGRGVPQDDAQALSWYRLAAAQGSADATAAIARIERLHPQPHSPYIP